MALTRQAPGGPFVIVQDSPAAKYDRQIPGGPYYNGRQPSITPSNINLAILFSNSNVYIN